MVWSDINWLTITYSFTASPAQFIKSYFLCCFENLRQVYIWSLIERQNARRKDLEYKFCNSQTLAKPTADLSWQNVHRGDIRCWKFAVYNCFKELLVGITLLGSVSVTVSTTVTHGTELRDKEVISSVVRWGVFFYVCKLHKLQVIQVKNHLISNWCDTNKTVNTIEKSFSNPL